MKTGADLHVVVATVVTLFAANVAFGQTTLLQDDFARLGAWPWQNAMTHTALPAWSVPTANYIPPAANTHTQFDVELRVSGQTFTFLAGPTSGVNLVYTYTDPDGDLKPGSVGLLSWGMRSANDTFDTGYHPLGLECLSFSCTDQAAPAPNHLFPAEAWVLPQSWTRLLTKNSAGNTGIHSDGTDYRNDTYGNMRWDFSRGIFIDDTNWYMNATSTTPNIDFMGVTMSCNGGSAWTNYEVKVRVLSTDNDGLGLLLRAADAYNFYRVTFCSEGPGTGTTRPPQGVSVQKCRGSSSARTWSELARNASFIYTPNRPFDVKAIVQDDGAGGVNINITVIDDPLGTPTTYTLDPINDPAANNPIPAGSAGLHCWGNNASCFGNYGGVSTPLVVTTDADPITLVGDVFTGYNDWISTYNEAVPPTQGRPASWGIRLLTTANDLIEPSDGCQERGGTYADPHSGGVANDGTYVPYLMVKGGGFTTGSNDYIVKARLRSWDNDGMGLVFGYQDDNNYFRVGVRNEATSSYGFAQGASFQKVVNGVITNLYTATPSRSNLSGMWVQKLNTGGIEQAGNHGLSDGSGTGQRAEFQGPQIVRGDVNWTDYTYEAVIEVHDDDALGLLFRYQDEQNYYRLSFCEQNSAGGPPPGVSIQKIVGGVGTQLFSDPDATKSGDNDVDPTAGFIYGDVQDPNHFRTWRTHLTVTGGTFRIVIDGIADDGTESPGYYAATVTDGTPLTHGKVGIFAWAHNANEFRDIKLTRGGAVEFDDGNKPDEKGWMDVTTGLPFTLGVSTGTTGTGAGAPCSGIGVRPELQALGVRDNRYIEGTTYIVPGTPAEGTTDWEGPRAVAGEFNWKDYTYTVDLRAFDDDGIGILIRYQDEQNFYRLVFLTQSDNTLGPPARGVSLQKRRNGTYSEVWHSGTTGFLYQVGETWRVELAANGDTFHLKVTVIDGSTARVGTVYEPPDFTDPTDPILTGKIGVTCWGMSGQVNEPNLIGSSAKSWLDWTLDFNEGAVFDNVLVVGNTGRSVPDFNGDGYVNGTDLILFQACFTGPGVPLAEPVSSTCRRANQDGDEDVDLADFGIFQLCYSGEFPLNPDCIK